MSRATVNKDHVWLWVDALRSGHYKQTTANLADKFGFCCLGVACEVAMRHGVPIVKSGPDGGLGAYRYDGDRALLPDAAADWLGFERRTTPYVFGLGSVASANDAGATFETIADAVERKWLQ